MSYDVAMTFRKKISEDPALQKQVQNILTTGKPADFVTLGHKHGYEFSEEDIKKVVDTLSADKNGLSEFELDMVAGGTLSNVFGDFGSSTGPTVIGGGGAYVPPQPPGTGAPPPSQST